MPTRAQITLAPVLDATGARMLVAYIRGSELYREVPGVFPNLVNDVNALVGVSDAEPFSDLCIKSKQISALLDALEELGPDGTVGLKGGRYGIQYSLVADREQLLALALNILYDTALYTTGGVQLGAASAKMNCPVGDRCGSCGLPWFVCNSTCAGYRLIY